MLPAVRFYTYAKRFEEAYAAVMRPLTVELGMAQPAVDILLFLANNPGMDTARDICTYRHLKPAIVSGGRCRETGGSAAWCARRRPRMSLPGAGKPRRPFPSS